MVFGENPNKVKNIVTKSMAHFYSLYLPVLRASFSHVVSDALLPGGAAGTSSGDAFSPILSSDGSGSDTERGSSSSSPTAALFAAALEGKANVVFRQSVEPETRLALGMSLPFNLQKRMAAAFFEREAELQGTALDGKFIKRLREQQRKAGELQQSIRAALQASPAGHALRDRLGSLRKGPGNEGNAALLKTRAIAFAASGREMMQRARLQRLQWIVSRKEKREAAAARALAGRAGEEIVEEEPEPITMSGRRLSDSFKRRALKALENRASGRRDSQGRAKLLREELKHLVDEESSLLFPPGTSSTTADFASSAWSTASAVSATATSGVATVSFQKAAKDPQIVAFWDALLTRQGSLSGMVESSPLILSSPSALASAATATPSLPPDLLALRVRQTIKPAIAHIVGSSARRQSLKGILTAGPVKAVQYAGQKLQKFFAALKKN
jgi:Phosphatidate cytidylyltransferase, mitochondrial